MKKLIIANWKMQLPVPEALFLLRQIVKFSQTKHNLVICPDFLALSQAHDVVKNSEVKLGAQNCAIKERGALTGEVSACDIRDVGASYVIIGHSERRRALKEEGSFINAKIKIALENDLIPILCLGESLMERRSGRTRPVLSSQLKVALKGVKIKKSVDIIMAYEPVWAIGSGKAMISEEADKIHKYISDRALKLTGKRFKVVYGGSVNIDNAPSFLKEKNIDGLLVGGASLHEDSFKSLLKS